MNTKYLEIIKAPVITEKSSTLAQEEGKYVFKVDPKANKTEIKEAIDSGCHIIPINPDGAFEGWPKDLPNEIELIKRIHISEMNMDTIFKESIQHIEETRIRKVAHPKRFPKTQDNNSGKRYNLKIITDTDCIISIDGYDCGICKANKVLILIAPILVHGLYDSILFIINVTPAISGILLIVFLVFCHKMWKYGSKSIQEHLQRDLC